MLGGPVADLWVRTVLEHEFGQRVGGLDDRLRWGEVLARQDVEPARVRLITIAHVAPSVWRR